ncbi:MAG TPA: DUF4388 domain-containing protein [Thermoleophilia bacterium]|nr:DUF4388 domain-containing protein [Thermoleophilia bacterium]
MGLMGDLGELPLPDLVQMTSVGGKTGRLVLYDEEGAVAGVLMFRGGRLVGARAGELAAEKAFFALLGLKTGSFDFDPQAELEEDEVDLSTESLLIEGMRRLDEVYRLRRRLPAPALVRYRGGSSDDPLENRVLGYLGPGARTVGDIVEGLLVGGDADEYDALTALFHLAAGGTVRVDRPTEAGRTGARVGEPPEPPQPELER